MNFLHIAGHLGADPEVRFTSSGKKVTSLRVATRARKGGNDDTIWWRVSVWGEQYDKMISYLKKGSAVVVFGELQKPEIFTDREGKSQISMEISANHISFSPFGKPDREGGPGPSNSASQGSASGIPQDMPPINPYMKGPAGAGTTLDDEVPF